MDPTSLLTPADALAALGVTAEALTEAQRRDLDGRGYLVLPGVIPAGDLDRLRSAFDRACDLEGIPPRGTRHPARLLDVDAGFLGLVTHPALLAAVLHVLGRPFRAGFAGRDPLPGYGQQGLHSDWGGAGSPAQFHAVTALGMLDAFTEDNGATRLVPGSHRARRPPPKSFADPASRHPDEVVVTAPAGSLLVFNGHLWHGGTVNRGRGHRRAVQCSFQAREHVRLGATAPPALDLPPAVCVLLGFDPA